MYRVSRKQTKKNLTVVRTDEASPTPTENYAETNLLNKVDFQKQNLALRYKAKHRFLLKVSSSVRQKGSSSGNERPYIQQN